MMDIGQLRTKYRQIINKKDEEKEEEEMKQNKSIFALKKSQFKNRVLTEHHENITNSKYINQKYYHNQNIIHLKERIAQNIKILAQKDDQIATTKQFAMRLQQKVIVLEQRLADEHEKVTDLQKQILQQQISRDNLSKEIKNKNKQRQQQKIDKQLLLSQIQFYKKEISGLKNQNRTLAKKIQSFQKENKQNEVMRNEIGRLKEDIKRMHVVINQCSFNSKDVNFNSKHFVGVCMKELNHWVPSNLVGEVQLFLKKEQIGFGNKSFLNNLVKFIEKYSQAKPNQKSNSTKNKANKSQIKPSKNVSHCRSSSLCQNNDSIMKKFDCMTQSSLKRSLMINKYKKLQSRMHTQSIKFQQKPQEDNRYCNEMFNEYKSALECALNQKQIKKKNIVMLSDQLKRNILSLMQLSRN